VAPWQIGGRLNVHHLLFPNSATEHAGKVDWLFLSLILLSAFYLALIFCPMIYFIFKYRRGKKADRSPIRFQTWKLEVVWTVIPFFMMMGIFAWAADLYYQVERPPANALEAFVVGKQWMWKIEHAEGNREINELHVPVGEPVKLTMTAEDVIHSFFIPAFRVKQDVVPGRYVTEWFRPARVGTYHIFCAEYCGANHSVMGGNIIVMNPEDYAAWLTAGAPRDSLAKAGEQLFRDLGCSGCHMGSTVIRAPRLEGVYGSPVPLESGEVVTADDQYIRDSILLPASQIAAGYSNAMPTYQGRASEEQVLDLIAYIRSLANKKPPENSIP
jgi:cytochrome c oxidase subunit 2